MPSTEVDSRATKQLQDSTISSELKTDTFESSFSIPDTQIETEVKQSNQQKLSVPEISSELQGLAPKVQKLLDTGVNVATIKESLSERYSAEDAQAVLLHALAPKIDKLREQGVSEELILETLSEAGVTSDQSLEASLGSPEETPPQPKESGLLEKTMKSLENLPGFGKASGFSAWLQEETPDITLEDGRQLSDVIGRIKNLNLAYEADAKALVGATGLSPRWKAEAEQAKQDSQLVITQELNKVGLQVQGFNEQGEVLVQDPKTGEVKAYDEELIDLIDAQAGEFAGTIMGAVTGGRIGAGAVTGGRIGAGAGPYGAVIGAALGGIFGAMTGRGHDVIRNSMELNRKITVVDTLNKMNDAGIADATMSALGTTAIAAVKGTWKYGKQGVSGLSRAWDLFVQGNKGGAQQTIKDVFNLNDAQVIELVTKWENITGQQMLSDEARTTGQLTLADAPATIRAVTETLPGAENVVARATEESKTGGILLAESINKRAKDIAEEASRLTNERVDVVLQDKLGSYKAATKDQFAQIKDLGLKAMEDSNYRFDFSQTALIPAMSKAAKGIHKGELRRDFYSYIDTIRNLGTPENPLRSFENLLELRKVVNELRGDNRFKSFAETEQMKAAIVGIDREIESAALEHMPEGKTWLKHWKLANTEYSNMLNLEKNVLYKVLTNPRISADRAVKAITQSMMYTDPSTFMQVMGKLPERTRKSVEGAVLKYLVGKHTMGTEGGKQALNLPGLANDLDKIAMTQPAARDLKRTIKAFAEVFKNDPHLLAVTGNVPLPKFQAYLTADPVIRAKFEFASTMFNAVKSRLPFSTNAGRAALVKNLGTLLDNPLNAKAAAEVTAALPKDPELKTALHNLAIKFTDRGVPENYGKVPIYRVAAPGKYNTASKTQLGEGMLYYTDKALAEKIAAQTGHKVREVQQLHRRIATTNDVIGVLGREPTKKELSDPEILQILKDKDFAGIAVDDKVLLFKD